MDFLVQLIGLYLVIMGAIVAIRRRTLMPTISDFSSNKGLVFAIAMLELIAGLALVMYNPDVSFSSAGIVALVGWMMLVESIIYLLMPFALTRKLIASFNKPEWYLVGGIVSVALGAYLLYSAGVANGLLG